jgi:hypothetical protein
MLSERFGVLILDHRWWNRRILRTLIVFNKLFFGMLLLSMPLLPILMILFDMDKKALALYEEEDMTKKNI